MTKSTILLADDLADMSSTGRSRSHLIRDIAAELGRRLDEPLKVLCVSNNQEYFLSRAQKEKIKSKDRVARHFLGKEMSHYPIKSKIVAIQGEPVTSILKQEKSMEPLEMIVLGSHGKSGLKKAIIGSVSEEVLRHATTPVLVLGPKARENKFELPMDEPLKILLLTDLSPASWPAEEYAISLALRLNALLTVCYSVGHQIRQLKEMLYSRRVTSLSIEKMFKDMPKEAERKLERKVRQIERRAVDVEGLLLTNEKKVEDAISNGAASASDLIVMGTHSRNKLLTAFIGSSARNLILKAPVPVIICRSYNIRH